MTRRLSDLLDLDKMMRDPYAGLPQVFIIRAPEPEPEIKIVIESEGTDRGPTNERGKGKKRRY